MTCWGGGREGERRGLAQEACDELFATCSDESFRFQIEEGGGRCYIAYPLTDLSLRTGVSP